MATITLTEAEARTARILIMSGLLAAEEQGTQRWQLLESRQDVESLFAKLSGTV